MKTDRELLELAAKAAGILTPSWCGNKSYIDGMLSRWNPLEDDGDSLRLAVKLNIQVLIYANCVRADGDYGICEESLADQDPYAATRRAIVRAAAAIGEGME